MEFLEGTKQILRNLNLYTRPPVDLKFVKISCHFIEYFVLISMTVTTIPIAAFCYFNRDNFQAASAGVLYFIANTSIKIIYLALLAKRKYVIEAVDHLEELIRSSKNFIFNLKCKKLHTTKNLFELSLKRKFESYFIQFQTHIFCYLNSCCEGISLNLEMKGFHQKRDQQNNKLAQTLIQSGIYTILFFFLPNALPPLMHFLFGVPKDIIWNFPFPVSYVVF